jgi:CRISPR-associated protein Cas2
MSEETRRFMRLLVFFDLPVTTKEKRRFYVLFRRFLIQDGYDMIQWSVYGRMVNGIDNAEKHLKRLSYNLPPEGSVRCLQVSEKQFANMRLLVGRRGFQEKKVNANQLLLF